ncbi:hypothetical protein PBOI14_70940 [Pseudomonas sp. Boi14]|nr:hypothetical protein PBOI14_70940 [Pseudomonas sp. Boi14]
MGIIHHQPGATGLGCPSQGRQVGDIAVHAEHPIGDHQGIAGGLFQTLGQAVRIVVQIAVEARTGKQPRIEQRRVVETILQHRIALPHQRRHRPQVGHVAGGKQQRPRAASEFGQRLFQGVMGRAVADHQMGSTTAHAPAAGTGTPGFDHLRMVGQAQVVVVTKGQQWLTVDHHLRPLGLCSSGRWR